jgi:hypothetical protein
MPPNSHTLAVAHALPYKSELGEKYINYPEDDVNNQNNIQSDPHFEPLTPTGNENGDRDNETGVRIDKSKIYRMDR